MFSNLTGIEGYNLAILYIYKFRRILHAAYCMHVTVSRVIMLVNQRIAY